MLIVCSKELPKELCERIQENVFALKCKEHKKPRSLLYDIMKIGKYLKMESKRIDIRKKERSIRWFAGYMSVCRVLHGDFADQKEEQNG